MDSSGNSQGPRDGRDRAVHRSEQGQRNWGVDPNDRRVGPQKAVLSKAVMQVTAGLDSLMAVLEQPGGLLGNSRSGEWRFRI